MNSLLKYLGKNDGHFLSIYQHYIDTDIFHRHDNCPWFVNHDTDHINGVLKNLNLILEKFKSVSENFLTDDEVYFLLCAAVFHDTGMLFDIDNEKVKEGSNRCETAREMHGLYSCEMIKKHLEKKIEMDNGVEIVCEIMKYHQSKAPLNEEYKKYLIQNDKIPLYRIIQPTMDNSKILPVRTELLAALLQLADAFDVSSRRAKFSETERQEDFINAQVKKKIHEAINHFMISVKKKDENMLDVLNEEKFNIKKLEISLGKIREYTDYLNSNSKSECIRCLEEAINIAKQTDHMQKHQAIHDIYFEDETICIKTVNNHKTKYSNKVKEDIISEVKLTDFTFLKYLPNKKKFFSSISIYNENGKIISRKAHIFTEGIGKLESDLKNWNNDAWNDFEMFKLMCKTHRKCGDFCKELDHCEDSYTRHCEHIEEQVKNIIDTYKIHLHIDELFTILCAIWGHELCNLDILNKSNFSDCKLKLDEYIKQFSPIVKGLFNRTLFCARAHTDYILLKEFKTFYTYLEVEKESPVYGGNNKKFDFNMPQLFWLLRYCELINKSESYCRLDFPHWSLSALKRCWPIDFKNRDFCTPGSIVKIQPDQNMILRETWHDCKFTDINKFLYAVMVYELNKMCDEDIKNRCIYNEDLRNYVQTFDDSGKIDDKYLRMCKDFASEKNQLKKIFKCDNVNISEFDDELIKNTLLEVNGDYLCDIFMKSCIKVSSSDSTHKTDDPTSNFLHSDKCVCTGLKLNGTHDTSYLFSWNNDAENDYMKLIEFLKDKFNIEWVQTENIRKPNGDKTIVVSNNEKSLSLKLNDDDTKVNLSIYDGRVDEFTVKTVNGDLNIHDTSIQINNIIYELFENCTRHKKSLYKALYLYLAVYCNKEYDIDWAYKKLAENPEGGTKNFNNNLSALIGD